MTSNRGFVLAGLALALLLGAVLANLASQEPDGLESAVIQSACADAADPDACLDQAAGDPVFDAAPLPDYEFTWLAGVTGVLATFGLGAGLGALARGRSRRRRSPRPAER